MAAVQRLPLSDFFRAFKPTHVLGTTYTASLAFFEGLVFPQIDRTLLRRCLLLCDRVGFRRALVEASALRLVGREYMVACAPWKHSFHPKVWLMLGVDEAALLVGSGNLTQSGFTTNLELFDAVRIGKGGPHRSLVEDVLRFLDGLRGMWAAEGRDGLLLLDTLSEMRDALEGLREGMPPEGSEGVRFLTNFGGPLVEQFRQFFGGGTVYAAAPYFGGSASAIRSLHERLAPDELRVFPALHGGDALDLPLADVAAIPGASARRLAMSASSKAFAHLKVYGGDGPKGAWLFTTSANCTEAALSGKNVEAGLMRAVSRPALMTYFAEGGAEALPENQRIADFPAAGRWLTFTATNGGGGIELVASAPEAAWIPLGEVRLTLRFGGQAFEHGRAALFAHGPKERIDWGCFPEVRDTSGGSPLLTVRARSADGEAIEGAAFVDQPLLLTSEPGHRSAWRATLAILDGEGLPEAADLACVFHLVQGLFEPRAEGRQEGAVPSHAVESRAQELADRTPLWPPISAGCAPRHFHAGGGQGVQWFQKILSELLGRTQETGSPRAASSAVDREEDGSGGPAEPPPALVRAARQVWSPAADSFDRLVRQLDSTRITAASAPRVWPVSVAILLVTLATRTRIATRIPDRGIPDVAELVGRFLRALFADRGQRGGHGRAGDDRQGPSAPAVASSLHDRYAQRPTQDLADILRLLFAYQHASSGGAGGAFFLDGWLLLREIAPEAMTCGPPPGACVTSYRRFLDAGSGAPQWSQVASSWEAILGLGWPDHLGFQELTALARRAEGGDLGPPLPAGVREHWTHTERRLRAGKAWRCTVSRLERYCTAEDCPMRYTSTPTNGALSRLRPTICRGCGSVLVPARLAQAFGGSR